MMHQRPSRYLAAICGIAMAASLGACSSNGSSSPKSGGSHSPEPAPSSSAQSMDQLKAAAAKEGKVVWYTTFPASDLKGVIDAFNKDYPGITVQTLRMSGPDLAPRVTTEQRGGKFNGDVIDGDAPSMFPLINAGALEPYDPPDEAPLPGDFKLPKGYSGVVYLHTQTIAYNPTVLKQKGITPPTTWEDFTKPEWKGHFSVIPDALDFYESLIAVMGHEKALDLLKALGNNSPMFVESHTQADTQVQAGEPWATAVSYGYKAAELHEKTPDQMAFTNPDPIPVALNLIDVLKKPPHPAAAKLFVDWMVSQAGQKATVAVTNQVSVRDDAGNDTTVYDPTKWKPVFVNSNISNDQANALLAEMKQALHAQ